MPNSVTGSHEPNIAERAWQSVQGLIQFLKAGSILGIADQAITEYWRKLEAIADTRIQGR
jgi:hypothetical protein